MAASPSSPDFQKGFDSKTGTLVPILPGVARVTAPNSGPYTFKGTNSFIVGHDTIAVVDPGPDDPRHLKALRDAIGGRRVVAIVLTHTHRDHSALARRLKAETGAQIVSGGPHRPSRPRRLLEVNLLSSGCDWSLVPDATLADDDVFAAGDLQLKVMATPGHCANHLAFGIVGADWLLTGDHIMGWNSTLVAVPDGSMSDYLQSLEKVIASPYEQYLPAHGGEVTDGPSYARSLLAHRQLRNKQIVEAVNGGARRTSELLSQVYPQIAPILRIAARMTIGAHIEYLEARREIRVHRGVLGLRLSPA
jgi:glyoxylase-like metal-dependent hydrolase (beta-lactamase superfamily II)